MNLQQGAALVTFLLLTAAAAAFGATFKPGTWYAALAKPSWTPPNWLFAPVWTTLYVMIAVAGWLAWRADGFGRVTLLWVLQLVLNAAWSRAFFGQQRIGLALADIALLWLVIGVFVIAAWPVSRTAALLFLPYWLWVSYASALNFAIWRLNP